MAATPYDRLKEAWYARRPLLGKDEMRALAMKDSFSRRLKGFLTVSYWKREKLIARSEIVLGLVFKEWRGNPSEGGNCYRDWVLFSPSVDFNQDPKLLFQYAETLMKTRGNPPKGKAELRFYDALFKPLSDANYLQVPPPLIDGKLAYLSIVERHYDPNVDFRLGIYPFLTNPSVSKEILFLPPEYWPEEDRLAAEKGENPYMKGEGK